MGECLLVAYEFLDSPRAVRSQADVHAWIHRES
jgi:hypothetical protein